MTLRRSPASKALTVGPVRNGLGLIAARTFRRSALIVEIGGEIVTAEQVWRYWDTDAQRAANCIRYDEDHYLDPQGEIAQYSNHSCAPNTGIVKRGRKLFLQAIEPIAAGAELTHDYSTFLGADDVWTMRCNCGEANCRRVVRNFSKLPAAVLARYRGLGIIPDFILATAGRLA